MNKVIVVRADLEGDPCQRGDRDVPPNDRSKETVVPNKVVTKERHILAAVMLRKLKLVSHLFKAQFLSPL